MGPGHRAASRADRRPARAGLVPPLTPRTRARGIAAVLLAATVTGIAGVLPTGPGIGREARCGTVTDPPVRIAVARAHLPIDGWSGDQLANAAVVMNVARARGLPHAAEVIGVMTAMGESSLRNIGYGDDAINPDGTIADSVGLFQQQHFWGTREQRLDPAYAAGAFYDRLVQVDGWQLLRPTIAAHDVQINADPEYYTRNLAAAEHVVRALDRIADQTLRTSSARPAAAADPVRRPGGVCRPAAP